MFAVQLCMRVFKAEEICERAAPRGACQTINSSTMSKFGVLVMGPAGAGKASFSFPPQLYLI
jgi:hypothetical protein